VDCCEFQYQQGTCFSDSERGSRKVKRRVLRNLETAGLITVEQRLGKNPRVTLIIL
jgi:hypothetical protein